jgi:hypothetical protein
LLYATTLAKKQGERRKQNREEAVKAAEDAALQTLREERRGRYENRL